MAATDLSTVLRAIRWADNVETFCTAPQAAERINTCLQRIAIWARQLESADADNPALCFVREAQVQGHYVAALLSVALYKPAASAMRALVENALYYSFFRSHPKELATLVRDSRYYLQKSDIVEFHKQHTDRFVEIEQKLGLVQGLNDWYRLISGIVHGQIPGRWGSHARLAELSQDTAMLQEALTTFEKAEQLVHELFLATVAQELWHDFAKEARKKLLHNLSGEVKRVLGLSIA